MTNSLAAIVLAAGQSRRMGTPKAHLVYEDRTFFVHVMDAVRAAEIPRGIVVTNPEIELPMAAIPSGFEVLLNDRPQDGQLRSLKIGLSLLSKSIEIIGTFVLLVDNPRKIDTRLAVLRDAALKEPETLMAAGSGGETGHPLWLPRRLWEGLLAWSGPDGARGFLESSGERIEPVEAGPSAVEDIDTPEDYRRLSGI